MSPWSSADGLNNDRDMLRRFSGGVAIVWSLISGPASIRRLHSLLNTLQGLKTYAP
jgi:hypothetical protein